MATNNYKREFEKASRNLKTEVEWVDVAFAKKYLAKNDMNRPANQNTVDGYAEEILNGWWAINGETIIISDKDRLLDGQQRLMAVVKTGIGVGMNVARGAKKKDFDTMNQGRIRSNGTIYNLEHKDTKKIGDLVSAVVKAVHSYQNNGNMSDNFGKKFSPRMMKHLKDTTVKGVEQSVHFALRYKKGGLFTQSAIASLHYVFSGIDAGACEVFLNALITGDYGHDKAIRELHQHFNELRRNGVAINRNRPYVCGVIIKGWNAWRQHETLRKYDYKRGEGFPKAI